MRFTQLKRLFLGDPLASQSEQHERLSIPIALAVFASDALSSTAYATEEILIALAASVYAVQANLLSLPVAAAITLLMVIVVLSYRQVIKAYPAGGGTYTVSKEELGPMASQVAGAALLIDYVLTVAVSISAGVAALTSTGLVPQEHRVTLALLFILFIMLVNLRGVRESGKAFAVPAYLFIIGMTALLGVGLWQVFSTGGFPSITTPPPPPESGGADWLNLTLAFVFLKAFSHGCAALTGIEAISNGTKAFKEPIDTNANKTMVIMACLLGSIFGGMTLLAFGFHIVPSHTETVISQLARTVFGGESFAYYYIQFTTMVILVLAANTSFAGFPRLATILAQDGFLPRQLMNLGDRLVFSNGIVLLGVVSAFLVWLYRADTHALIPLYAVGVFLSFTLAQASMVRHQRKTKLPGWRYGAFINSIGALTTGVVTVLLTVEKFVDGAWIVLIAIPVLIATFQSIRAHYQAIGRQLALPQPQGGYCPTPIDHRVLVLVSSLNRGTIPALEYAKTIGHKVEAVHIELDPKATQRLRDAWETWGCGIPLTVLHSQYRAISGPLLDYVYQLDEQDEQEWVTVVIPEFVTKKFWHNFLHNQTSLLIKTLLRFRKGKVVVTTVRYYLEE